MKFASILMVMLAVLVLSVGTITQVKAECCGGMSVAAADDDSPGIQFADDNDNADDDSSDNADDNGNSDDNTDNGGNDDGNNDDAESVE